MDDVIGAFEPELSKADVKRATRFMAKSRKKDSVHEVGKLAESDGNGGLRIKAQHPVIIPHRDFPPEAAEAIAAVLEGGLQAYLDSLPAYRADFLQRFTVVDSAIKVVGVGSVGTRCWILLLQGKGTGEPFFLQLKEAGQSVLADHLPGPDWSDQGERVVVGQRRMQAVGDSFLGWFTSPGSGRNYYVRQFKDMKGSFDIDTADEGGLRRYAETCGYTLARAHARTGDRFAVAGYLGAGKTADRAFADFAVAYADQNESDYAAFSEAIESGRLASVDDERTVTG